MNRRTIYKLTHKVQNPQPDARRRETVVTARESWPAGSLWVKVEWEERVAGVQIPHIEWRMKGCTDSIQAGPQWKMLEDYMVPFNWDERNGNPSELFSALILECEQQPEAILRWLYRQGVVNLDQLRNAAGDVEDLSEQDYELLMGH